MSKIKVKIKRGNRMKLSRLIKEMVGIADSFDVSVDDIEVNVKSVKHKICGLDNRAVVEIEIKQGE